MLTLQLGFTLPQLRSKQFLAKNSPRTAWIEVALSHDPMMTQKQKKPNADV